MDKLEEKFQKVAGNQEAQNADDDNNTLREAAQQSIINQALIKHLHQMLTSCALFLACLSRYLTSFVVQTYFDFFVSAGLLHLGTKTFIRDNRNFDSSEFNSTGVKLYIFIHNEVRDFDIKQCTLFSL
jgi:hypothetical protein